MRRGEPDRAGPDHEDPVAVGDLGDPGRVEPDRERLDQCAPLGGQGLGSGNTSTRRLLTRISSAKPPDAPPSPIRAAPTQWATSPRRQWAQDHRTHSTGSTAARSPSTHPRVPRADRDHLAAQLVAHHRPLRHGRPGLEVRAADAAARDPQHQLARPGRGIGVLVDGEAAVGARRAAAITPSTRRARRRPGRVLRAEAPPRGTWARRSDRAGGTSPDDLDPEGPAAGVGRSPREHTSRGF